MEVEVERGRGLVGVQAPSVDSPSLTSLSSPSHDASHDEVAEDAEEITIRFRGPGGSCRESRKRLVTRTAEFLVG